MKQYLWEILVPAQMQSIGKIPVSYHQEWDDKVLKIAGGLTVMRSGKGYWTPGKPELNLASNLTWSEKNIPVVNVIWHEKMIPVRIMCTKKQIEQIADITAAHYKQEAVMFYKISDNVVIKKYSYDPQSDETRLWN